MTLERMNIASNSMNGVGTQNTEPAGTSTILLSVRVAMTGGVAQSACSRARWLGRKGVLIRRDLFL